jgi:uncharacterized protein YuzE
MAQTIKVWYDPEGDFLEVLFSNKPGYMRETDNDAVMERVDERGNILGFSILRVRCIEKQKPLVAELK